MYKKFNSIKQKGCKGKVDVATMTKEHAETEVIEAKFTVSSVVDERVPTGIDGLDPIIKGCSPKGSLVLLAGNPVRLRLFLVCNFYIGE